MLRILFTLFLLAFLLLSSCDTVYFVAINNYGPPCRVNVKYYNKSKPLYYDNDTLRAKSITSKTLSKQIVRTNIERKQLDFVLA